ncbi:MAG: hypothetical protein HYZ44_11500 [Bacteroidetes bacterium]|nr:hypothetical protein [Bacteroidota bacterium]
MEDIKREGFSAKEEDMVVQPSENVEQSNKVDIEEWRTELSEFFAKFNVDLTNYKFNRDELYDRP